MHGLCAKVTTMATVVCVDGTRFVGMNWCANPQPKCPRKEGDNYDKCNTICKQMGHAEVMACLAAGAKAKLGVLYLEGHTYACDNCVDVAAFHGIDKIVVGSPPPIVGAPALSTGN